MLPKGRAAAVGLDSFRIVCAEAAALPCAEPVAGEDEDAPQAADGSGAGAVVAAAVSGLQLSEGGAGHSDSSSDDEEGS